MSKKIMISKDEFLDYETVRRSGFYNMFDPQAREMTDLSKDEWVTIMQEYKKLDEAWSDKDES